MSILEVWCIDNPEDAAHRIERQDAEIVKLKAEVERLKTWVNDLQSGMYINCVYCGHRYGPQDKVPCSMAEALKKHIEQCPKHPMSALKQDLAACRDAICLLIDFIPKGWEMSLGYNQVVAQAMETLLVPSGETGTKNIQEGPTTE